MIKRTWKPLTLIITGIGAALLFVRMPKLLMTSEQRYALDAIETSNGLQALAQKLRPLYRPLYARLDTFIARQELCKTALTCKQDSAADFDPGDPDRGIWSGRRMNFQARNRDQLRFSYGPSSVITGKDGQLVEYGNFRHHLERGAKILMKSSIYISGSTNSRILLTVPTAHLDESLRQVALQLLDTIGFPKDLLRKCETGSGVIEDKVTGFHCSMSGSSNAEFGRKVEVNIDNLAEPNRPKVFAGKITPLYRPVFERIDALLDQAGLCNAVLAGKPVSCKRDNGDFDPVRADSSRAKRSVKIDAQNRNILSFSYGPQVTVDAADGKKHETDDMRAYLKQGGQIHLRSQFTVWGSRDGQLLLTAPSAYLEEPIRLLSLQLADAVGIPRELLRKCEQSLNRYIRDDATGFHCEVNAPYGAMRSYANFGRKVYAGE